MIYGDHIRLRALELSDVPTMTAWFNDPEVRRYLLVFAPMSQLSEERWVRNILDSKDDFVFGIEVPAGEGWQHIGNVGLHHIDWKHRSATFGIVIGMPAFWNQGHGSDATRTMTRFAFDVLNLHRVQLDVFDFNPRARRVYEKIGFKLEGTRRQALFAEGQYHDEHIMAVLRAEFREQ